MLLNTYFILKPGMNSFRFLDLDAYNNHKLYIVF